MPRIFEFLHTVADAEIDQLGHANNVAYVEWMQSAAIGHSTALGWPGERYDALGCGWVVRSHTIEYHESALAGDEIVVRTWVATMKKVTSVRKYRIHRQSDDALLAVAKTKWAFVDYKTGAPVRVPSEVTDSFEVVEGEP